MVNILINHTSFPIIHHVFSFILLISNLIKALAFFSTNQQVLEFLDIHLYQFILLLKQESMINKLLLIITNLHINSFLGLYNFIYLSRTYTIHIAMVKVI